MDVIDRPKRNGGNADRVYTAGTFCKNPLSMIAMNAVVRMLLKDGDRICSDLNEKTGRLVEILNRTFEHHRSKIRVFNFGSFFRFAYDGNLSFVYQPKELQYFYVAMILNGVYIWEGRTCFLSTAHASEDLDRIIWAAEKAVLDLRDAAIVGGS
jgi:glutamate-1-semialdehyde aminotransferase